MCREKVIQVRGNRRWGTDTPTLEKALSVERVPGKVERFSGFTRRELNNRFSTRCWASRKFRVVIKKKSCCTPYSPTLNRRLNEFPLSLFLVILPDCFRYQLLFLAWRGSFILSEYLLCLSRLVVRVACSG